MYVNGKYCRVQESDYTTMQRVTMRYIVFATGAWGKAHRRFYRNRCAFPHHLRLLFASTKYSIAIRKKRTAFT